MHAPQPWQQLVPPLDVAFVWHLHRLSPSAYAADCQRLADAQGHVLHVELEQVCVCAFVRTCYVACAHMCAKGLFYSTAALAS